MGELRVGWQSRDTLTMFGQPYQNTALFWTNQDSLFRFGGCEPSIVTQSDCLRASYPDSTGARIE